MEKSDSPFAWAEQLGCPKKALTSTTYHVLSRGTSSMIWEHIAARIKSTNQIKEIKKNIILHSLKTGSSLAAVDSIKSLRELKTKQENIEKQIESSESDIAKKEFVNRQLAQQYKKKQQTSHKLEIKNIILKAKCLEKQSDNEDLIEFKRLITNLQPPESNEIDPDKFEDCLSLVTTLIYGANKKEVFQQVDDIVETVAIPTLWDLLRKKRSETNDELFQLINDIEERFDFTLTPTNYGFAKLWQKHILIECANQKFKIANAQAEDKVFEYIHVLESAYKGGCPEFLDWLPLILEVNKKEIVQTNLRNEIESLKKLTNDLITTDANESHAELAEFEESLKIEQNVRARDLGKSLKILKNVDSFITETRNNLILALENLQSIVLNENWLDIDVKTELIFYHENFDLDALRKISLKGTVNEYRHLCRCINAASTEVCVPLNHPKKLYFPMLKSPIYHLLDCFKAFMMKQNLCKEMDTLNELSAQLHSMVTDNSENFVQNKSTSSQLIDIIMETDITCDKIAKSITDNNDSLNHWINQPIEKVALAVTSDLKVNELTLEKWKQRYTAIIYDIVHNF